MVTKSRVSMAGRKQKERFDTPPPREAPMLTPNNEPNNPSLRRNGQERSRSRGDHYIYEETPPPRKHISRYQAETQSHNPTSKRSKQRRNRGQRTHKASIDINLRVPCPPCEEPRQAKQAARVAKAPCHVNWNTGYHPGASSRASICSEPSSESSSGDNIPGPHRYQPIDNFSNSGPVVQKRSYVQVTMSELPAGADQSQQLPISRDNGEEWAEMTLLELALSEYENEDNHHTQTAAPNRPAETEQRNVNDPAERRKDDGYPFQETASGNLKIHKKEVLLQTHNLAVLVADSARTPATITETHIPPPTPKPRTSTGSSETIQNSNGFDVGTLPFSARVGQTSGPNLFRRSTIELDKGYETEPAFSSTLSHNTHYGGTTSKGSKTFLENMHYRVKKAINPDTKVVIGNREFPIHGIALQCYSKYAEKQRRTQAQIMELRIPEEVMHGNHFLSLMDWIVMGEEEKRGAINRENVVGLFSGATYLGIPQLQDDCFRFLKDRLQDGDPAILNMYREAKERDCRDLIALLATKLAALFPKIYNSKQFLHMNPRELILLLSADNIVIRSELDVYDAAARWLLFDWDGRKDYAIDIMKTVRFGLMTPLQLTQIRHAPEAASLPNYQEIFGIQEVKKLVEDGQTYAILKDSYQGHPGELQRWLKASGVEPPRDRRISRSIPDSNIPSYAYPQDHDNKKRHKKHNIAQGFSRQDPVQPDRGTTKENRTENRNNSFQKWVSEYQTKKEQYPVVSDNLEVDEATVEAATLIQSVVRRWIAKKRFNKLKKAALAAQAIYRASQKKIPIKLRGLKTKEGESIVVLGGYDTNRQADGTNTSTAIFQLDSATNQWILIGHLPEPRARQGTVQIDKFLYIFGGEDRSTLTKFGKYKKCDTTWSLDVITGEWKVLSRMTTPRSYFGYALLRGKIYVFGGLDENARALSTCEVYDPREDTWSPFQSMDGPRLGPAVAKVGEKIWVVGGFTKVPENPMLKTTIIYDAARDEYEWGPELPFSRCNGSLIVYYDELVLLGGATYVGNGQIQSLSDVSHLVHGEWVPVGHLRGGPRHGHCAIRVGKYVLLVGGVNSESMTALDQVESFSLEKFRGTIKVANLPLKLSGPSGVVVR